MYVLVTIEDDGWASETYVRGVYSSLELVQKNFDKVLNGLFISYQCSVDKLSDFTEDYAEYYNGDTWFKVYYEKFDVDKEC